MKPTSDRKDLDGGWGWVVVFGSSITLMLVVGIDFALGPFFVELQRYYQATSAEISWIMSLGSALKLCVGPIAGALSRRFGARIVVMAVGALSTIGYLSCSFATGIVYLYISYGVFTASILGVAFAPTVSLIGEYFEKKYALANGMAFLCTGIGGFVLTLIFQAAIDHYGWRGAYIILAGINSQICVCSALFRPPTHRQRREEKEVENGGNTKVGRKLLDISLFREFPTYTVVLASEWPLAVALYATVVHLAPRAVFLGMTANQAALIVSVFGITGTFGRLHGFLIDKNYVSAINLYRSSIIVAGITSACSPFLTDFPGSMVHGAILGFCVGVYLPLFSVLFREIVGQENLVTAFGYGTAVMAAGVLIAPPMAGWIFDATGDYHNPYYAGGCFFFVSALITVAKNIIELKQSKRQEETKRSEHACESHDDNTNPVENNSNVVSTSLTVENTQKVPGLNDSNIESIA
ncbi:monocarboxylate transporter 12-like [Ptychodera flava]|uniref:monocarboxylate transporter 12-like n=1 Tax=Ptychodera flava TaxID=63121 RepID=UPI003969E053